MESRITLSVFRDDSPLARELHNRRKDALHEIFDGNSDIQVVDWGLTDDTSAHEFVELVIVPAAVFTFHYAVVPGLNWLAIELAKRGANAALDKAIPWIISEIGKQQKLRRLLNAFVKAPDGTEVSINPPDGSADINIFSSDGERLSKKYGMAFD